MVKTIVSIWPMEQTQIRPQYSPISTWTLPAAPFDGFVKLKVTDQQQTDYVAAGMRMQGNVPADELARDLARSFSMLTAGGSGAVGVWVADEDDPTDEQILNSPRYHAAREAQEVLMKNIVVQARYLKGINEERAISRLHHAAAGYLRLEGEDWQGKNIGRSMTKECPYCTSFVQSSAVICPKCTNVIDAEGHARIQAQIKNQIDAINQQASIDNGGSALRPARAKQPLGV